MDLSVDNLVCFMSIKLQISAVYTVGTACTLLKLPCPAPEKVGEAWKMWGRMTSASIGYYHGCILATSRV
jgi:hypothetical protein